MPVIERGRRSNSVFCTFSIAVLKSSLLGAFRGGSDFIVLGPACGLISSELVVVAKGRPEKIVVSDVSATLASLNS